MMMRCSAHIPPHKGSGTADPAIPICATAAAQPLSNSQGINCKHPGPLVVIPKFQAVFGGGGVPLSRDHVEAP